MKIASWIRRREKPPTAATAAAAKEIDRSGDLVRITQTLAPNEEVRGLQKLLSDGKIQSYSLQGNQLIIYADKSENAEQLTGLERVTLPALNRGMLARAKELLVPPNLSEDCAPEYLRFRAWSLGSKVCAGVVGFMTAQANLDALKIAFSTSETAVLVGAVNGFIWKGTAMAASYLAHKGDADPKKWMMISEGVGAVNSVAVLGILAAFPHAYAPLYAAVSLLIGTTSTIGSAAGINIFNHMARGDNKGQVQSKNSNQEMIADSLGIFLATGMGAAAAHLGMGPMALTMAVFGPLLTLCSVQAVRSVRLEAVTRGKLEKIVDHYIDTGEVPRADATGVIATVKSLVKRVPEPHSRRIEFEESLGEVVDNTAQVKPLFDMFTGERYLLNISSAGQIRIGLRKGATMDDIIKAYTHARLVERGLDSPLWTQLQRLGDGAAMALNELAYDSLPAGLTLTDEMHRKGWYWNPAKIGAARVDAQWHGNDRRRVRHLTIEHFKSLVEKPNGNALDFLRLGEVPSEQPRTTQTLRLISQRLQVAR